MANEKIEKEEKIKVKEKLCKCGKPTLNRIADVCESCYYESRSAAWAAVTSDPTDLD